MGRAEDLGWSRSRIEVIDDDLGVSGRSIEGRTGFQRLLAQVSLEHVGIVVGIEMSRLARSCRDWHHLLELCAMFGTILGDADGVYDPRDHNDRLLLGLKGTMSEAELHVMRGRLRNGQLNKANRGENEGKQSLIRTSSGIVHVVQPSVLREVRAANEYLILRQKHGKIHLRRTTHSLRHCSMPIIRRQAIDDIGLTAIAIGDRSGIVGTEHRSRQGAQCRSSSSRTASSTNA